MNYPVFESIISPLRMQRYLIASGHDTRQAMVLYRLNLHLSQELFTLISCFEIALRNAIDDHYTTQCGADWLRDAIAANGVLNDPHCWKTRTRIEECLQTLPHPYHHSHILTQMNFGFWRYLFARDQYRVFGKTLLRIFPQKPSSTATLRYDNNYIFNSLEKINSLRNRIAHHEPVCFASGQSTCCIHYAQQHYRLITDLFQWLSIRPAAFLYGLDHVPVLLHRLHRFGPSTKSPDITARATF